MYVCASSVVNGYTGGGEAKFALPTTGVAYLGGATTFTRIARTGIIAALDVTTNTLAWRYQWPEQCYSGTLATGGGLLFVGRNDGRLTALDSATGTQLWEFQTGAGMHAPVSTFEHSTRQGVAKQYVLAFSAGSALIGSARGDSVWLFSLDGTLPPVQAGTPVSRQAAAPAATGTATPAPAGAQTATPPAAAAATTATSAVPRAAAANLAAGRRLYEQACVFCHGADGKGDHGGAPLVGVKDLAAAMRTVASGRNDMPSFGSLFTPAQIRDVSAYVVEAVAE
jgi:mono/diheme cytochrome c family protein